MSDVFNKNGVRRLNVEFRYLKRRERYGNECFYCGARLSFQTFSLDHIIPVSKGGTKAGGNIVAACKTCNGLKSDLSMPEFAVIFQEYYGHPLSELKRLNLYIDQGASLKIKVQRPCRVCGIRVKSTDFRRVHTNCLMDEPFVPKVKDRPDWQY